MITVESGGQGIESLEKLIAKMKENSVLVGIPEDNSSREGEETQGVTNAELAFLHTNGVRSQSMINEMNESGMPYNKAHQAYIVANGSPLWRIPPRPIIEPALEYEPNAKLINEQFENAAKGFLESEEKGNEELEKLGLLSQGIVKDWFDNPANNWPANAPSTIKAKEKKGSTDPKPLVDEGQLRNSINYVIKKE